MVILRLIADTGYPVEVKLRASCLEIRRKCRVDIRWRLSLKILLLGALSPGGKVVTPFGRGENSGESIVR